MSFFFLIPASGLDSLANFSLSGTKVTPTVAGSSYHSGGVCSVARSYLNLCDTYGL